VAAALSEAVKIGIANPRVPSASVVDGWPQQS
jgi:hypothetical protein